MTGLDSFTNQKYLNIETFRKSGVGVRTPVWFVQENDVILVQTEANSGKVKRIRNNGQVKIAPCKMDGALLGDWTQATAREVIDEDMTRKAGRMLDQKYGLMKKMFALASVFQKSKSTILEIKLNEKR